MVRYVAIDIVRFVSLAGFALFTPKAIGGIIRIQRADGMFILGWALCGAAFVLTFVC